MGSGNNPTVGVRIFDIYVHRIRIYRNKKAFTDIITVFIGYIAVLLEPCLPFFIFIAPPVYYRYSSFQDTTKIYPDGQIC